MLKSDSDHKFSTIKQWAEDDRPREKLLLKGRAALSDAELLAILISTGSKNESALDLARKVLSLSNNNLNALGKLSIQELQQIKGIGEAKAITIAAALELGRRRKDSMPKEKPILNSSRKCYEELHPMLADMHYEEFWVLYLNRKNELIKSIQVSKGGVAGTVVDARLILKPAIECLASNIVLGHNHPSGNLKPSEADIKITRQIKDAARLLDMQLIDHIIVGNNSYYSFADEGML
jgi:DNA repair protein RadC